MPGTFKRSTITYDDFAFGEFGALGSWNAPKGSFTGQNVVRYVDGSLGPRNGLKAYTLTGTAAREGVTLGVTTTNQLWFQDSDGAGTYGFYRFDPTSMASQAVTTIVASWTGAGATTAAQAVNVGNDVFFASSLGIHELSIGSSTVTLVDADGKGSPLIRYGDRYLTGGAVSPLNRLYYSDAADINTWPAANFIDIGSENDYIAAIIPLRSAVAIATADLYSAGRMTWWILTGVPGVNDSLREVLRAQGPSGWREAALLQNGTVLNAAALAETMGIFDGSMNRVIRHLLIGRKAVTDEWAVYAMRDEADALFLSDSTAVSNTAAFGYFRRDDAWTKQAFSEAEVSAKAVIRDGYDANLVVMMDKSSPPVFYAWEPYNDRPPFSADTYASILDPSDVSFTLPEWWARDGDEVSVRKVIVSFRDWDTDDANANQFDVQVTPLRKYEAGAGSVQTGSFSRATSESTAAGTDLRREWNFTQDWGNGFKVGVANMRGVAIHKIQVALDVRAMQAI